jgi:hypothetical protein
MSMIVAQITAEMGVVLVKGHETVGWANLLKLSIDDLQRHSTSKSVPFDSVNNVTIANVAQNTSGKATN